MQLLRSTAALLVTMVAGAGIAVQAQQADKANLGDLRQASSIEIRDAGGTAVLTGTFKDDDDGDDDLDKEARLAGSGTARGEADIDIDDDQQELDIELHGVAANETFTVWIDGRQIGSVTTNADGRADVDWDDR